MRRRRETLLRWVFFGVLGTNGLGAGFHFVRLGVPIQLVQWSSVILQDRGDVRVLRPQRLLNNLAQLYHVQGQYAEAVPLYQRALAIREKALGPEHPDVAQSLNNLAGLYDEQGHYAHAERALQLALAIR